MFLWYKDLGVFIATIEHKSARNLGPEAYASGEFSFYRLREKHIGFRIFTNVEYWQTQGLEQFLEWKNDFYRARNVEAVDIDIEESDVGEEIRLRGSDEPPQRRETIVNRVIRDSALSRFLKSLYNH
jgi:hypothetical protein